MIRLPHPRTGEPADVPSSWGELSLAQAQTLLAAGDDSADTYGLLGALFTPRATRVEIMNLPAEHTDHLLAALEFLSSPFPPFEQRPDSLLCKDLDENLVSVVVPNELKIGTFGQACDLGQSIEALADDVPALRIRALAIYLMPQLCGAKLPARYDSDLLPLVERRVAELKLAEAIPVVDFFLPLSRPLLPSTESGFTTESLRLKNSAPGLRSSGNGGTLTRSLTRWRSAISSRLKACFASPGAR